MGLNETPSGERIHIGFFGRRNAGKSSLVNAVTGQQLAVVSDTKGTTTDPVYKAMELLPLGPVMIIDTPGLDDEGALGELRIQKTREILRKTDLAVLVVDSTQGLGETETQLRDLFRAKEIPYLVVYNKADLLSRIPRAGEDEIYVSALAGQAIDDLKNKMAALLPREEDTARLVGDLLTPGQLILLVTPIDEAAPKGRLILPQQQMIRDILDAHAMSLVVQEEQLAEALRLYKPDAVITDSQAFATVSRTVPQEIPLTSFSILMARYKGFLDAAVHGAAAISRLQDGDKVLVAEGCSHHRQCGDIGTVKLPAWLKKFTGKDLTIVPVSGREFPEDLTPYALVIHCGGCMLNLREVKSRMDRTLRQGVPFTNYGVAIAYLNGILKRSLSLFPHLQELV